ncbi:hypothetical protein NORO109296_21975 [Nocardiopsis rhodophaea]
MEPGEARQREFDDGGAEGPAHLARVGVGGLDAQVDAGRVLLRGVEVTRRRVAVRHAAGGHLVRAGPVERQPRGLPPLERGPHLALGEVGLGVEVEAGEHQRHVVAEPGHAVEADLEVGRRGLAPHSGDPDAVRPLLREPHGVEPCRDIRPGVARPGDLVDELCGDGPGGDRATRAVVLGDDRRAIAVHLRDGESGVGEVVPRRRELGEEGVVSARGLGTALDDVPGHHGTGQCVVVVARPAEVRGGGSHGEGGVGDAAGHDDVGPGAQGLGDAPGPEVGVGGQRAPEVELGGAAKQVVAFDMGHAHIDAEPHGEVAQPGGESSRIEPAGVGHDRDAPVGREPEALLHLPRKRARVPEIGVPQPVPAQDEHGELGEVVAGQHIQPTVLKHLPHRGEAVPVEPGGVADPQRCRGRHAHGHEGRSPRQEKQARVIVFLTRSPRRSTFRHGRRVGSAECGAKTRGRQRCG